MTPQNRFKIQIATGSNDTWGWNGWVVDKASNTRHPLIKTYIDYELHGEVGYGTCAFDTRDELVSAAKKKARALLRAA